MTEKLRPFRPGEFITNADGSRSTERTVTIQDRSGAWVNVPSLWKGPDGNTIDLGEDENRIGMALDFHERNGGQPFPRFKDVNEAVSAAKARSEAGGASAGAKMIEVELPDGTIAEFPDGTPPEVMKRALQKRFGAPQASQGDDGQQVGYMEDMGRSAASGLRQGVEGLAGMIGDAAQMTGDASAWLAGKLGASEGTQETVRSVARRASFPVAAPTTREIQTNLTTPVVGEHYQPQTAPGEYARTVAQFAPAALSGPGGVGRNAAVGFGAALASETGGQLTKGTAAEPYARAGGALLGGLVASRIPAPGRKPILPTSRDIKSGAGYQALKPEMQAARIDKGTYRSVVRDLQKVADDFGMVPEQHAAFKAILERHAGLARRPGGASLKDLEILRRSLQNAGKSTVNRSSGELARQMVDKLDEIVTSIPGSGGSVAAGRTVGDTITDLQAARETWRTGMKAEVVEMAMERAQNTASGLENGLRIEFRKILNNKTLSRMFTDTEKKAMQQVVRGTFKGNALRLLGGFGVPLDNARNFLGSVMGGGIGSTLGAAVGGPAGAAVGGPALVALGTAAKSGANAITRNNAAFVEALVKAGPQGQRIAAEALMELQAARNLGLARSGVLANQAFNVSRASQPVN